jgi:Nif-specific regulatory protein
VEGFDDRARSARIKVGEGITGQVVESGKPIVVPRVSREPGFMNMGLRRSDHLRQELSFICVPIVLNRIAVGTLGVDLRFKPERDYDNSQKFFGIVSSMIAQALNVQRLVEEERRRLLDENTHLRQELRERYDFSNIIGTSGPTRQMYEQVAQVAQTNTTVLIRGESGTGKELIAHAIHYNSLRAKKPFIKVSCAALPDTLIESELFGYEKGAFTGAVARKKGRFEMAEGGTLFLDEIGDITPATQVALLRVLQERTFERVGGSATITFQARLVCATNRDLAAAVAAGEFREDLFHRINLVTIIVPPLRERRDDIPELVRSLLGDANREAGKSITAVEQAVLDQLRSRDWPGNVRELEHVIKRSVLTAKGTTLTVHDLALAADSSPPGATSTLERLTAPLESVAAALVAHGAAAVEPPPIHEAAMTRLERTLIEEALKATGGNQVAAARLLGISRSTLRSKLPGAGGRDG